MIISCVDASGHELTVSAAGERRSLLVRVRGQSVAVRRRPGGDAGALAGRFAFVVQSRALVRLDVRTGRSATLARVPPGTGSIAVSPDGRRVAAIARDASAYPPTGARLVLVTPRGAPRVRTVRLGGEEVYGTIHWLGNERLVFLPGTERGVARVFDLRLRVRAEFRGFHAHAAAVVDGVAYGITYAGELQAARLPRGPVRPIARLPGPALVELASAR